MNNTLVIPYKAKKLCTQGFRKSVSSFHILSLKCVLKLITNYLKYPFFKLIIPLQSVLLVFGYSDEYCFLLSTCGTWERDYFTLKNWYLGPLT